MAEKKSFFYRVLDWVEKAGNFLPHPMTLFASFAVMVVIASGIVSLFDVSVIHPGTGETIRPVNLLTGDGLRYIMTSMVTNFTGFAPLGTVLVALLGIGVAEGSGLLSSLIRLMVTSAPPRLLTVVLVFCGVMSNAASEVGYVLLVPLAGIIFLAVGRHPLAGMAAAFAGVSGGYSANLVLGTVDPLLSGISQEAARIVDPAYLVNPACNYYFMAVSTFILTIAGTFVSEKIVEPRLGKYTGDEKPMTIETLTSAERRGLRFAFYTCVIFTIFLIWSVLPANGWPLMGVLLDPKTGGILHSPFLSGIVAIIFIGAGISGVMYGIGAGTIKKDNDVANAMGKAMSTMGSYIALVFCAAQFVAYFQQSKLGLILAVEGAEILKSIGLPAIPLLLIFILVSASINMMMGSASAKWAIMAPVFVPMFMLLGYTPEITQTAYRIGDSVTNVISPMMSYFALIVAYIQKYSKTAGMGTVISTMAPYSVVFLIVWSLLFAIFIGFDIPVGPGSRLRLAE
ncbi:AbgT family transporter [bacterium]|nr:AbgT family transporter [bacterium]